MENPVRACARTFPTPGAAAWFAAAFAASPALAYEHHDSRVNFEEYADDVIERLVA